jgi:UDP-N-acetylmuramoylalanine--D-glutamate ligase
MKKKALVLGLGLSGKSAARFLLNRGYEVLGIDSKNLQGDRQIQELLVAGALIEEEKNFEERFSLKDFSLLAVSPGISKAHPLIQKAQSEKIPVQGEVDLALGSFSKGRAVGITGTNGKTTVTSLVAHILHASGKKAKALGNIGTPLTEYFLNPDPEEIAVIELSSYQLETLRSPVFDAAVILNVTPDHLDRYASFTDYAKAKAAIQYCLKDKAPLYLHEEIATDFGDLFTLPYKTIGFKERSSWHIKGNDIWKGSDFAFSLPDTYADMGTHDRFNALASWVLCETLGVKLEEFIQGLRSFKKPAHRVEFVQEIDGVHFYDDSKGTNVDAVIQAVGSMKGPVVLIAGGVDKGSSYLPWKDAFQSKVKKMILLGQSAPKIAQELSSFFSIARVNSLEEAVTLAKKEASPGDSVLLSPGCSSFDMFSDYAHRGREFQRYVLGEEKPL